MFEKQIAAGMAYLDEHDPGWLDKIDLGQLDIMSCKKCVIGQLHREYSRWLKKSAPEWMDWHQRVIWGATLGFSVWSIIGQEAHRLATAQLTREWKAAIKDRRANLPTPVKPRKAAARAPAQTVCQ